MAYRCHSIFGTPGYLAPPLGNFAPFPDLGYFVPLKKDILAWHITVLILQPVPTCNECMQSAITANKFQLLYTAVIIRAKHDKMLNAQQIQFLNG